MSEQEKMGDNITATKLNKIQFSLTEIAFYSSVTMWAAFWYFMRRIYGQQSTLIAMFGLMLAVAYKWGWKSWQVAVALVALVVACFVISPDHQLVGMMWFYLVLVYLAAKIGKLWGMCFMQAALFIVLWLKPSVFLVVMLHYQRFWNMVLGGVAS